MVSPEWNQKGGVTAAFWFKASKNYFILLV
jgi:hypothetical protein